MAISSTERLQTVTAPGQSERVVAHVVQANSRQLRLPFLLIVALAAYVALNIRGPANALEQRVLDGAATGLPELYPAVVQALPSLTALRVVSLAALVATIVLVRSAVRPVFGERAALLSAGLFAFCAPVMFVGHLASPDALALMFTAGAMAILAKQVRNDLDASAAGIALGTAVLIQYATVWAVLPVLAYGLVASRGRRYQVLVALGWAVAVVSAAPVLLGTPIPDVLPALGQFQGGSELVPFLWLAPLFVYFVVQGVFFVGVRDQQRERYAVVLVLAVAGALAVVAYHLPGIDARALAWAGLFLAPLAGWGLARWWRMALVTPLMVFLLFLSLLWGGFRGDYLHEHPAGEQEQAQSAQGRDG